MIRCGPVWDGLPFQLTAHVAELVDAHDSGSCGETRGGSSPLVSTFFTFHPADVSGSGFCQECVQFDSQALCAD